MIDAQGTITSLDGDYAVIQMDETTGCGRCHEEGGCGGNNIAGNMFCNAPRTFRVLNSGRSAVGDRVTIVIADGAVRRGAALAYGLPLLGLLSCAIVGSVLAGEIGAIVGAIGGLSCSWLALRCIRLRSSHDQHFKPYIS